MKVHNYCFVCNETGEVDVGGNVKFLHCKLHVHKGYIYSLITCKEHSKREIKEAAAKFHNVPVGGIEHFD